MIKGGKGGARTKTGLKFERRIDIRKLFAKLTGYKVKEHNLFYHGKIVAQVFKKNELYSHFLKHLNVDWNSLISQQLLPDQAIFVLSKNILFIIEMKFQHGSGSVDEKLQTCDFKKRQYQKLLSKTNIKVEYAYILNDWFKHARYNDVMKYIRFVGCHYFFEELPLKFLGLPKPRK